MFTHEAEDLTAEEFLSDEAEELGILRCLHLLEHYANYAIGFSSQFLLAISIGYVCVTRSTLSASSSRLSLHIYSAFIYWSTGALGWRAYIAEVYFAFDR